jgi:hypothetical protein
MNKQRVEHEQVKRVKLTKCNEVPSKVKQQISGRSTSIDHQSLVRQISQQLVLEAERKGAVSKMSGRNSIFKHT